MDRMELGWLMFEELDQADFEAWLDKQRDAEAIASEIGGVYAKNRAKSCKKRAIVSMQEGRVVLRNADRR